MLFSDADTSEFSRLGDGDDACMCNDLMMKWMWILVADTLFVKCGSRRGFEYRC
jgi:hypothetical protein